MFHNSHASVRAWNLFQADLACLHSHLVEDWGLYPDLLPPSPAPLMFGGLVPQLNSEFLEGSQEVGIRYELGMG